MTSRIPLVRCVIFATAVLATDASARADQVGTLSVLAGTGENTQADQSNLGDGGPALTATMFQPRGVAVASDGTVYFADTGNFRIRRIRTDGVIETIAGTGVYGYSGNGGAAVNAELSDVLAIALDPSEQLLYLADDNNHAVRRVNLVTGVIEHIADIPFPQGIAVDSAGQVLVSETISCAIRNIDPATGVVSPFVGGTCTPEPGADVDLLFPTRLSIDGTGHIYVVEAGTDRVRRVDVNTHAVSTVAGGGSILPGSGDATSFNIGIVTDVAVGAPNELFVSNEGRVFRVDLATNLLTVYGGTGVLDVEGDCNGRLATECDFNNVGGLAYHDATGRLLLADANNARVRAITRPLGGLSFIGTTLATIECPAGLTHVAGDLTISNNASATTIICPVESVNGNLTVEDNPAAVVIDFARVTSVDGNLTVEGNASAETITIGGVVDIDGNLTLKQNGAATVEIGGVEAVNGNLTVESTGTGNFDADACVSGMSNIDMVGYASVTARTAMGGTTNVTMEDGSIVTLELQPGTFPDCVAFSIARTLTSVETGTDAASNTVTIDGLVAYQFVFAVPTLGFPAELTFDIPLSTLSATRQAEVLDALASGTMTLVTKGDSPDAAYHSFEVCGPDVAPAPDGCVTVQALDAIGNLTTGIPAVVRFTGIVGHFSTWAVAIVTPLPVFNGLLQPYPAPPHTARPTFKRGSVVPLKFNWTTRDGIVIDSATASPSVTIYSGTCSGEPTTTPIAADDAGQSDGFRYDAASNTWVFGWSTKALAEGCYWIKIATGNPAYGPPSGTFPIALR